MLNVAFTVSIDVNICVQPFQIGQSLVEFKEVFRSMTATPNRSSSGDRTSAKNKRKKA